jgi:hypothetical protein
MAEGSKINYYTTQQGNGDGDISLGNISFDGTCTADVSLRASDGHHFFEMTKDGPRKGWTTSCAPGAFNIECAELLSKSDIGFSINTKNGDIIIKANNGKIRLEANDIELSAKGPNSKEANIVLDADGGAIKLKSNNITLDATSTLKLISNVYDISAEMMKMRVSIMQGLSCATKGIVRK